MPIILARHAERLDYVERDAGRNWIASSAQPWNTPLTGAGGLQAAALGRAIARHIEAHRLPPVTRIYCSPLLRCVQTAAAAAAALASASGIGIDARIDLSLMEHMGEAWYRSWCIGGVSDSTWGGPDGRKAWGTPVDEALIHPLAKRSASELLPRTNAEFLASLQARGVASSEGASSLSADLVGEMELLLRAPGQGGDTGAGTVVEADFRWGEFETHAREEERVTRLFDYVAKAHHPGETVLLVSHGSPTSALFRHSQRNRPPDGAGGRWPRLAISASRRSTRAHRPALSAGGRPASTAACMSSSRRARMAAGRRPPLRAAGRPIGQHPRERAFSLAFRRLWWPTPATASR